MLDKVFKGMDKNKGSGIKRNNQIFGLTFNTEVRNTNESLAQIRYNQEEAAEIKRKLQQKFETEVNLKLMISKKLRNYLKKVNEQVKERESERESKLTERD